MKTILVSTLLTALAGFTIADAAAAEAKKLLVVSVTTGYRHSSIPTGEKILADLSRQSGKFQLDFVRQPDGKPAALRTGATAEEKAAFAAAQSKWEDQAKTALEKLSPDQLKNYDGVIFLNTTGNLPIPDRAGFLAWIDSGKAFIGMHAASDTFHGWAEFTAMIGGEFDRHGRQVGVDCLNQDTAHPATAHLPKSWTIAQEEIYEFKNYNSNRVHELLVLDKHPISKEPGNHPVAWCRDFGKGKVFYTSLGHREDIWDADPAIPNRINPVETSKAYQAHLLGGIEWALGLRTKP